MASSVGIPRPLEGARGRVGGGVLRRWSWNYALWRNDIANSACSGGRWDRLSRASCKVTAPAIALLDQLRLQAQWPSDAVEFLPRRKNQSQYNSQPLVTFEGPLTKNRPHVLRSGWPCGSRLQRDVVAVLQFGHWVRQREISHQWRRCLAYM